jgi:RNA polymerase sigma-70 factor (ECF subfamily)
VSIDFRVRRPPDPLLSGEVGDTSHDEVAAAPNVRQIVDEYGHQVWRMLRYCGVPAADVNDACQEVFLIVHRKLDEFEGRSSLRAWVYQICLRVAIGHRRRARFRHERVVAEPPEIAVDPSQLGELEDHLALERLLTILDRVEHSKRAIFVLYEIEERPMSEIAETLGCPIRTAYARLESARKEILKAWKRDELRRRKT